MMAARTNIPVSPAAAERAAAERAAAEAAMRAEAAAVIRSFFRVDPGDADPGAGQ